MAFASLLAILGNLLTGLVFLAPVSTFRTIRRLQTTVGYDPIPYIVTFFSCSVWLYYAILKPHSTAIISVNGIGCLMEALYISMYMFYSTGDVRIYWGRILVAIITLFVIIVILTMVLIHDVMRWAVVGWICLIVSIMVFASPLYSVINVIRTRNVNFMSLPLLICLALSGGVWFVYGVLEDEMIVAIPNIIGFVIAIGQIVIYLVYRYALAQPQPPPEPRSQPQPPEEEA